MLRELIFDELATGIDEEQSVESVECTNMKDILYRSVETL